MPGAAQDQWLRCEPVRQLHQNLGLERQATFSFCFTWLDEVNIQMERSFEHSHLSTGIPLQAFRAAVIRTGPSFC